MAKSRKIRVMLSSRCNDAFRGSAKKGGRTLSDIRRELKLAIEGETILGRPVFEVWINEDAPPADGTLDSWDSCLKAVRECDILIVLSNGNAGWAKADGDIGICHAEYMEGLSSARGKVKLIALPSIAPVKGVQGMRDQRFQEYLQAQTPFRGGEVTTVADLKQRVFEALSDALITLTQRGVSAAASSRFDMGPALDWTRLDFRQRKLEMERVLQAALGAQADAQVVDDAVILPLGGKNVALIVHAIPAAFTVAAARELVGRPFLLDHERISLLTKGVHGPVHVIACHRTATETQATTLLGFPDATVVSGPFGVYVADDVQKVQFVFLVNCRDESQTRHALQRFLEWLQQTGEADILAKRAESRAKIVKVIANEIKKT
jgi:hypothetical protein